MNGLEIIIIFTLLQPSICDIYIRSCKSNQTIEMLNDVESGFGTLLIFSGISGYISPASPLKACFPIESAPNITDYDPNHNKTQWPVYGFIALIESGNCSFDRKVFNAQEAGFIGAIVYNENSDYPFTMRGRKYAPFIDIPSVMVGVTSGLTLMEYQYPSGFYVTISPFLFIYAWYYFIAFLCVVGVSFLVVGCVFGSGILRNWLRQRANRLTKRHLSKLPERKFRKSEDRYESCAICLDDYEDGEKIRILPCDHAFHSKCVDPWLLKNNRNCPICKRFVELPGAPPIPTSTDEEARSPSTSHSHLGDSSPTPSDRTPLLAWHQILRGWRLRSWIRPAQDVEHPQSSVSTQEIAADSEEQGHTNQALEVGSTGDLWRPDEVVPDDHETTVPAYSTPDTPTQDNTTHVLPSHDFHNVEGDTTVATSKDICIA